MALTGRQEKVLQAICIRGGGISAHEAIRITGLDYNTLERTAYESLSKGYKISALASNNDVMKGQIKRLFLSKDDPQYNRLIENS